MLFHKPADNVTVDASTIAKGVESLPETPFKRFEMRGTRPFVRNTEAMISKVNKQVYLLFLYVCEQEQIKNLKKLKNNFIITLTMLTVSVLGY